MPWAIKAGPPRLAVRKKNTVDKGESHRPAYLYTFQLLVKHTMLDIYMCVCV